MHSVGFELTIPSNQTAADPHLKLRGHRDRLVNYIVIPCGDPQHTVFTGTTLYSTRE